MCHYLVAAYSNFVIKGGSYDAFLKIIILCNRICWHVLMFKRHIIYTFIIFQILYIIVVPLCPASQTHLFLQSPSYWQAQSALIGQLAQCIVIYQAPQALVGNVTALSIIASPICVCTQAAIKTVDSTVTWPCLSLSLPLSHIHTHTHTLSHTILRILTVNSKY